MLQAAACLVHATAVALNQINHIPSIPCARYALSQPLFCPADVAQDKKLLVLDIDYSACGDNGSEQVFLSSDPRLQLFSIQSR